MTIGEQGEEVVAQWLVERGGEVLYRRWRCQRGEIDTIAIESGTLLFIEVKTRDRNNWDADGMLAIDRRKQRRLINAAEVFLVKHSHLAEYPVRFDVAIVRHQSIAKKIDCKPLHILTDLDANKCLLLIDYLPNAFEVT